MSKKSIDLSQRIFVIRGRKVMLDRDLAELYDVETKVLKQAVRRNIERFPDDFMFVLTPEEASKINNAEKNEGRGGVRYSPYVFTEHGVAMLSGVLSSPMAIQINIAIIRTFIKLRELVEANSEAFQKIARLEFKYDAQFELVFEEFERLKTLDKLPVRKKIRGLNL